MSQVLSRKQARYYVDHAVHNIDRALVFIKRLQEGFESQGHQDHSEFLKDIARALIAVQELLEEFKKSF